MLLSQYLSLINSCSVIVICYTVLTSQLYGMYLVVMSVLIKTVSTHLCIFIISELLRSAVVKCVFVCVFVCVYDDYMDEF